MPKTSATDFSRKKAFELGYALFRVAAIAKSRSFAETLETKATALLDSIVSEDYETARATIKHIEYFMRFGTDAGLLHLHNAEIIIKEGSGLYAAIAGLPEPAILQELNFDKFFSKSPLQDRERIPVKSVKVPAKLDSTGSPLAELQDEIVADEVVRPIRPFDRLRVALRNSNGRQAQGEQAHHEAELQETDDGNTAKSAIRQSAILDRLRQTENCRFAELQELLPDVSERTLRYDLQSLADRGFIEKVGGRHGFYRSKTGPLQAIELSGVSSSVSM